jgi:hypothetical protein
MHKEIPAQIFRIRTRGTKEDDAEHESDSCSELSGLLPQSTFAVFESGPPQQVEF